MHFIDSYYFALIIFIIHPLAIVSAFAPNTMSSPITAFRRATSLMGRKYAPTSVFTSTAALFCSASSRTITTGTPHSGIQTVNKSKDGQGDKDVIYMQLALRHAQHAYREHEVPVGAVIVDEKGIVLAGARNMIEQLKDATAHAEVECLKKASKVTNNWRLRNCTLYTTLEPCAMCLGALRAARVSRVVFGAHDHTSAARHYNYNHNQKTDSGINTHPSFSGGGSSHSGASEYMTRINNDHTEGADDSSYTEHKLIITGGVLAEDSSLLLKRFFKQLRRSSKTKEASIL